MKAIVLLSGGLDSTVVLAIALSKGRECLALSFDYGQRHIAELDAACKIAQHYKVLHRVIKIDSSSFGSASLLKNHEKSGHLSVDDCMHDVEIAKSRSLDEIKNAGTPSTYVPARNTLFLSFAMAQAELFQANEIYVGANAMDLNYPDCRPSFLEAFQGVLNVATKQALEGCAPQLVAPLLDWDKARIVAEGLMLKAPLEMSLSCYDPGFGGLPCQKCDACVLRNYGFSKAE